MISRISFDSPIGPLTIEEENGFITSILFSSISSQSSTPLLEKTKEELEEYFKGERNAFDIPLALKGTEFQKKVWRVISSVPYGKTISYGEIGNHIQSKAYRAIGQACKRNPLPLIIPCHRVLGTNGIGGYNGGIDKKNTLLKLEGIITD